LGVYDHPKVTTVAFDWNIDKNNNHYCHVMKVKQAVIVYIITYIWGSRKMCKHCCLLYRPPLTKILSACLNAWYLPSAVDYMFIDDIITITVRPVEMQMRKIVLAFQVSTFDIRLSIGSPQTSQSYYIL